MPEQCLGNVFRFENKKSAKIIRDAKVFSNFAVGGRMRLSFNALIASILKVHNHWPTGFKKQLRFINVTLSTPLYSMRFHTIICLGVSLGILASCHETKETANPGVFIQISDSHTTESVIESKEFIASIDSMLLRPDSGNYISSIQDVCVTDSDIFILDKSKTIFVFNSETGTQRSKANKTGRGKGEYSDPKAIIADKDTLYVLDFQTKRVLIYNKDLSIISNVKIDFPALDFTKVSDGFLFYNMNATDKLKQVVHTDFNGQILGSFLPLTQALNTMPTDKVFCEDGYGGIYVTEHTTNRIYKWKDNILQTAFTFGDENDKADLSRPSHNKKPKILLSFITSNYVLTQFVSNKYVLNNIYNKKKMKSKAGIVSTHTNFPFLPTMCRKEYLISICHPFNESKMREEPDLYLVRYKIR